MAARCFVDTCGVVWSEVITGSGPAFQADVNLEPGGSLKCPDLATGLSVNLFDETVQSVSAGRECANILRRDVSGNLHALIPQVVQTTLASAAYVNVPTTASSGTPTDAAQIFSYANTTDCEVMVALTGQFNLGYEVLTRTNPSAPSGSLQRITNITTNVAVGGQVPVQTAQLTPFNAQWVARLKREVTGASPVVLSPVIADHFSTSGVAVDVTPNNVLKSEWRDFTWIQQLGANSTIIFTADIFHDGVDQTMNIATSGGDANTGFRLHNCDMFAMPLQVL